MISPAPSPRGILRFLAPLTLLLPALAPAGGERTWTDAKGRQVEAAMGGVSGNDVLMILPGGNEASVAIDTLSEEDQQWVAEWVAEQEAMDDGDDGDDGPPAEAEWPRSVRLEDRGEVITLKEDDEKNEYRYASEHYEFVCDSRIGVAAVKEFSEVFEAAYLVNCLLPLDIRPRPEKLRKRFLATIFTNSEDYYAAGATPGSAGVYMSSKKSLMLPLRSLGVKMVGSRISVDYDSRNYRTLIHEITHQMMNHWLGKLPTWYVEGSADYVELADYGNGRFSFTRQGSRLENVISRYGKEFRILPLDKLMNITGAQWTAAFTSGGSVRLNYDSSLVLAYFFHHMDGDGEGTHLFAYLDAIRDTNDRAKHDEAVAEHLMRGRSYEELTEELRSGMRSIGIKIADAE